MYTLKFVQNNLRASLERSLERPAHSYGCSAVLCLLPTSLQNSGRRDKFCFYLLFSLFENEFWNWLTPFLPKTLQISAYLANN